MLMPYLYCPCVTVVFKAYSASSSAMHGAINIILCQPWFLNQICPHTIYQAGKKTYSSTQYIVIFVNEFAFKLKLTELLAFRLSIPLRH